MKNFAAACTLSHRLQNQKTHTNPPQKTPTPTHLVVGPRLQHAPAAAARHRAGVAAQHRQEVVGRHVGALVVDLDALVDVGAAWGGFIVVMEAGLGGVRRATGPSAR
jgi:hypothetical protein